MLLFSPHRRLLRTFFSLPFIFSFLSAVRLLCYVIYTQRAILRKQQLEWTHRFVEIHLVLGGKFSSVDVFLLFVCRSSIGSRRQSEKRKEEEEITTKIRDNKNPNNPIVVVLDSLWATAHTFFPSAWYRCCCCLVVGALSVLCISITTSQLTYMASMGWFLVLVVCYVWKHFSFFFTSLSSHLFFPLLDGSSLHSYFSVVCVYIHLKRLNNKRVRFVC